MRSRPEAVKRILATKGVDYRTINYLEEPLCANALKQLLCSARLRPGSWIAEFYSIFLGVPFWHEEFEY
jgi:arsenate reductase-like glutaredoxin family protein